MATADPELDENVAILQRAFGSRVIIDGAVRRPSREEQERDRRLIALTTAIRHTQLEITGDGRIRRVWLGRRRVSVQHFLQRWREVHGRGGRSRGPRPGGRASASGTHRPGGGPGQTPKARGSPEPPSAPAPPGAPTCSCCERNAAALEVVLRELRALRGSTAELAPRPTKNRRRPMAPTMVVPTDLDRARARAALKRSGWKRVN